MHWKIDTAWISYEVVQKLQDGVSTERDSEVKGKGRSEEWFVPTRDRQTGTEDILLWTKRPTEGNSSELEARADAFWNVLEGQLLVSANAQ